ncbi:MAG: TetR family transcriptional regulator [Deltaproteobacteria bacterium]|nr:TetR family transcriptional regulator [Deltaproteobacteria bacterium]
MTFVGQATAVNIRGRRTRRALRQSAWTLFRAHGYRQTTVEQIAAGAAVSPRTFFRHYRCKEDLVFADAAPRLERFRRALSGLTQQNARQTVANAFRLIGSELVNEADVSLAQAKMILAEPALAAREYALWLDWERVLTEALGRAGVPALRATMLAGALLGALRGLSRLWIESDGQMDLLDHEASLFELIALQL